MENLIKQMQARNTKENINNLQLEYDELQKSQGVKKNISMYKIKQQIEEDHKRNQELLLEQENEILKKALQEEN